MSSRRPARGCLIIIQGPDALVRTQIGEGLVDRLRHKSKETPVLLIGRNAPSTGGDTSAAKSEIANPQGDLVRRAIDAGGIAIVDGEYTELIAGLMRLNFPSRAPVSRKLERPGLAPHSPLALVVRLNPQFSRLDAARGMATKRRKRTSAHIDVRSSRIETIVGCPDHIAIIDRIVAHLQQDIFATAMFERHPQLLMEFKPAVPVATPTAIVSQILPLKHTVAYDTYWRFAAERQHIFFKRLNGCAQPWTDDPIFHSFKFTNAYRASDRVSQYLIRHVIYRHDLPDSLAEVFFRIMLFKFFNKIETWDALESALGTISYAEFSFDKYDAVLTRLLRDGQSIYSAAYIMPSGGRGSGFDRKHQHHLSLLQRMMSESLAERLSEAPSMQRAFTMLKSYPSLGDFLAYQYVTDINYSQITNFPENDFTVPGPGALDGVRKCFSDSGGLNAAEVIKFMADRQEREFENRDIKFQSLWGRRLQLIDCQNLFCEVDKYSRVRHPELAGISGRTRIKQKFTPMPRLPPPWYPPKWKINDKIVVTPRVFDETQGDQRL